MAAEILFEDTEDGEGDEVEITGHFDLQVSGTGQGTITLYRQLGDGTASGLDLPFTPMETFTGPGNRGITNFGTNTFKAILSKTKDDSEKIVAYNQAE